MEHLDNPFVGRAVFAGKFKRRSRVQVRTNDKYNGRTGSVDSYMDRSNENNEITLDGREDYDPLPFVDSEVKPIRRRKK